MGTFIHEVGMLTIPEEKKAAFLADARKVAEQGGLFSVNRLSVFDRKISLLHFPDFSDSELKHLDFTYSYFEKERPCRAATVKSNPGLMQCCSGK